MESPSSEKDRDNDSQSTGNEDDDDSVEGSMSVQSEEIAGTEDTEETDEDDDDSDDDTIPPEVLPDELPMDIPPQNIQEMKPNPPESWPTLEILPGGVIKHAEKDEDDPGGSYQTAPETDPIDDSGEMMYACAKCPQRFKYLFCLVKHVRWHEDQKKKEEGPDLSKLNALEKELISIKRARVETERKYWKQKNDLMNRIADAIKSLDDDVFD